MEVKQGKNSSKVAWHCIRDIQLGRRGLVPVKTAVVKDGEGNPCTSLVTATELEMAFFENIQLAK